MYSKSRNANKPQAPPKISLVTLALQLVSGERLIAEFHPEGCKQLYLYDLYLHNLNIHSAFGLFIMHNHSLN